MEGRKGLHKVLDCVQTEEKKFFCISRSVEGKVIQRERVFPGNKEPVSAAEKQKKEEIRRQKTKKQLGTAVIEKKEVRIEETGKLIFEERNRGLNICINAQPLKIN